jgi:sarcosine oxidase subunit beta
VSKTLVCSCEDVTVEDFKAALAKGYKDIESVKRYTGFGTGICQGKNCLARAAQCVVDLSGEPPEKLGPFTPRPPLRPTRLASLAQVDVPQGPPPPGVPPPLGLNSSPHRPKEPVRAKAKVVIIGGGIMGLALAYNLAQRGERDVVVLERGYLCAGASGRNGGGVRMQWSTRTNIELARRSIELCKSFARDLGVNIWLRQGGYLFLVRTDEGARRLERNVRLQNTLGVPTELISPAGARDLVPQLSAKGTVAAAFNREDGVIFPWPFLWGYASGCQKLGVGVETFTRVTGFQISQGRVQAVETDRGAIACEQVVLAAGAWSPAIAELAGVKLPNEPHRHEILVTEPLKPFLQPLVSVLDSGLYFSQSMRGEIVGGMGDPLEPPGLEMGSTFRFLSRFSQAILEQVPVLGDVKVVRQWAGCYDVTPDNAPILGRTPGLENLIQLSGFVGHGFMMAPAVAERTAAWMAGDAPKDELFSRFNLGRFAEGRLEREDFIIG